MARRVALVTCSGSWIGKADENALHTALRRRGVEFEEPVWNDPDVAWGRFDAALIRTTWDYQERRAAFVAWAEAAAGHTRLFNPAAIVAWNTHKSYLRELEDRGLPLAPSVWLAGGQPVDLGARVREAGFDRVLIKPLIGATARETLRARCDRAEELAAAQAHVDRLVLGGGEDLVVQPYLEAVEDEGELSIVAFADASGRWSMSHGVRKQPVPGDYRVQDDFGAHDEPWPISTEARALAERSLAALCDRFMGQDMAAPLYARVDMLRTAGGDLVLNELELVEPSLFFRHAPQAADRLAEAFLARL